MNLGVAAAFRDVTDSAKKDHTTQRARELRAASHMEVYQTYLIGFRASKQRACWQCNEHVSVCIVIGYQLFS